MLNMANLIHTKKIFSLAGEMLNLKAFWVCIKGELNFFMNTNEECLLLFLKNPGRIDKTTDQLKSFIFSLNNNMISSKEYPAQTVTNPIKCQMN